jgi:hypothetical protein
MQIEVYAEKAIERVEIRRQASEVSARLRVSVENFIHLLLHPLIVRINVSLSFTRVEQGPSQSREVLQVHLDYLNTFETTNINGEIA